MITKVIQGYNGEVKAPYGTGSGSLNDVDSAENLGQWYSVVAYIEAEPFIRCGTWGKGDFPGFLRERFSPHPCQRTEVHLYN